jgi:hypothetical protein
MTGPTTVNLGVAVSLRGLSYPSSKLPGLSVFHTFPRNSDRIGSEAWHHRSIRAYRSPQFPYYARSELTSEALMTHTELFFKDEAKLGWWFEKPLRAAIL